MAEQVTTEPQAPAPAAAEPVPTVIVNDVHVVYRVYGSAAAGTNTPTAALKRMLTRAPSPQVRKIHAVRGVSLVAYEGEAIGLIGANGSGKSTLLRAIAGLLPVEQGAVYTKGQPSLLGVNAALLNDLSGERNVILGCLALGMSREQARRAGPEIIEFSGINENGDFSSLPMRTYSSGMASRLRFAIAAAKKHDVLLIDEALATGDARFRRRSQQRVRELQAEAGTVFLVSHSFETIRDTCARTVWLHAGRIRMEGPTEEIVAEYQRVMNRG